MYKATWQAGDHLKESEMRRYLRLSTVVVMLGVLLPCRYATCHATSELQREESAVTITCTGVEETDKAIALHYRITNDLHQDIWLCEDLVPASFEVYLAEDNHTLMIRRRFSARWNEPVSAFHPFYCSASYVRLRAGESRTESLLLPLPVRYNGLFTSSGRRETEEVTYADRIAVDIGFFVGDLFRTISDQAEEQKEVRGSRKSRKWHFPDSVVLAYTNEYVRDRDERVRMPLLDHYPTGARALRMTIDGRRTPYIGSPFQRDQSPAPPELHSCTRTEITYEPSMLQYFFPSVSQQRLLSSEEKQYLQSEKTITVDDRDLLRLLATGVDAGEYGGIAAAGASARVICFQDDKQSTSFTVYNDRSIRTEDGRCFSYLYELPSLREITPQVQCFELRLQCAANLKSLWYRLSLYGTVQNATRSNPTDDCSVAYPEPDDWCDAVVRAHRRGRNAMHEEGIMRPHRCPSAGEGKSHYAMNPNCRPDSPGEMVLLFETKAGWNQHGGPELFTFDNHDPKGGCVLLNDGTVKFIRTEAGLHALRWE